MEQKKTDAPSVSIVLPVYNGANYLARAIESCLAQSLRDFELLIVDDASTDATPSILAHYAKKDRRIKILRNERNKGLPISLNIGFAAAHGDYYSWISHDNEFYPQALRVMHAALEREPGAGLAYADFDRLSFNEDGSEKQKECVRCPGNPRATLLLHSCAVGACFLYRSSLAGRTEGYKEEWRIIEDYEYFLRLQLTGKFIHLDESCYLYRNLQDKDRLSIKYRQRQRRLTKQVLVQYIPRYLATFGKDFDKETQAFLHYKLWLVSRSISFPGACRALLQAIWLLPSILRKSTRRALRRQLMPRIVPLATQAPFQGRD